MKRLCVPDNRQDNDHGRCLWQWLLRCSPTQGERNPNRRSTELPAVADGHARWALDS